MPLYIYFPLKEWKNIERAEINDEEGNQILEHYTKIYKEKFLKRYQESEKEYLFEIGTDYYSNARNNEGMREQVKLSDFEIICSFATKLI